MGTTGSTRSSNRLALASSRRSSRSLRASSSSSTPWRRARCKFDLFSLSRTLTDNARSWEDLEDKAPEGQWTYFERNAA